MPVARRIGFLVLATAVLLGAGVLVDRTELFEADEAVFDLVYGLDLRPRWLDALVVEQHFVNYTLITLLTGFVAWRQRRRNPVGVMARVAGAALAAYAAVVVSWAVWERPRPQEALGITTDDHDWSSFPSYPSGHVVVTTAIAAAASALVPALRIPLWAFAALTALTRVLYGAHLPSDVVFGIALGYIAAGVTVTPLGWDRVRDRVARSATGTHRDELRFAARASAAVAVAVFLLLLATVGPPESPEGGVMPTALERDIQVALLAASAVTAIAAWGWNGLGAPLVVLGAALGVFAALQYTPGFAVFAYLAFAVPGALFLLAWRQVRRPLQVAAVAAFVAVTTLAGGWAAIALHDREFGPAHPQSDVDAPPTWRVTWVWSGGVTQHGARVKARLNADGRARLLVGRARDLRDAKPSAPQMANGDANDRIVSFAVGGLRPDTPYFYGVEVDGRVDPYRKGTFRTFPTGPSSFSFAFGGCARVGSNGAVFDAIRKTRPLFFLAPGDFFYANIDENSRSRFVDAYDRTLRQPAQGALYRSAPIAYVWDDHDYGGNDSDATTDSRPAARSVYDTAVPHYPLVAGARGPIRQAFTAGRVRFLLLDTRSARDPADRPDDAGKSMLGEPQKGWLKRELRAARDRYPLTVVVSSVPWIASPSGGVDHWGAYATERAELSRFIADNGIRNLLMLSADAHMVAIDDGSHSDYSGTGTAGFPVMHAAALDRPGSTKGGPFSEGTYPGAGQYGTVAIDDRGGDRIEVLLRGRNYKGEELVRHRFKTPASSRAGSSEAP